MLYESGLNICELHDPITVQCKGQVEGPKGPFLKLLDGGGGRETVIKKLNGFDSSQKGLLRL